MRYLSKPSAIDAVQWTGDNADEVASFAGLKVRFVVEDGEKMPFRNGGPLELRAGKDGAQGWVPVPVGHWLVMAPGDPSDIWPVDPDYFADKYRAA